MVQVGLYGTTGTYPSLAKDGSDVKYIFWPEPSFKWSFSKTLDLEDIPYIAVPTAYDQYTQSRTITLTGILQATVASNPPGAKSLKVRFEDLDKLSFYLDTFDNQPDPADISSGDDEVFCLEITFPDASVKQHFVTIQSLTAALDGGNQHLSYTLIFKEIESLVLI